MHTPEFKRYFVELVPGDTLMTLRLATKGWRVAGDAFIDEGVESGAMMVHNGNGISLVDAQARKEGCKLEARNAGGLPSRYREGRRLRLFFRRRSRCC